MNARLWVAFIALIGMGACGEEKAVNDPQFHETLLSIAVSYERLGRIDDTSRLAPFDCDMPRQVSHGRVSGSEDVTTHGQKIYYLFSTKPFDYVERTQSNLNAETQEISRLTALTREKKETKWEQVTDAPGEHVAKFREELEDRFLIVKESWAAERADGEDIFRIHRPAKLTEALRKELAPEMAHRSGQDVEKFVVDRFYPFALKEKALLKRGRKGPLFIMYQLDKVSADTDEGWVYGTVTPDGKTVTSAGRVMSCMKCHRDAEYSIHDGGAKRLFGLPEKVKKKGN